MPPPGFHQSLKEQLKKRLVGASVLAALAVIFVPMLVDDDRATLVAPVKLPPAPPLAKRTEQAIAADVIQAPVPPQPPPAPRAPDPEPPAPAQAPSPPPAAQAPPSPSVSTRAPLSAWVIQVGSFREPARADALVARLREAGIDTLAPAKVDIQGETWFRVRVGPEVDRQRAEALLPRVNRIAGLKGRVIRYP